MISVILKLIKKLIRYSYLFARAVKIRAASGRDLKAQHFMTLWQAASLASCGAS